MIPIRQLTSIDFRGKDSETSLSLLLFLVRNWSELAPLFELTNTQSDVNNVPHLGNIIGSAIFDPGIRTRAEII